MQELSKLILSEYQTRKTKAQKTAFIELIKQFYPDAKVEEGGLFHNRNIVIGDTDRADFVITAHYDTCAKLPFPNFLAPKNFIATLLYSLLIALPFFALTIAFEVLLLLLSVNEAAVATIAMVLIWAGVFWLLYFGKPNERTANDNTSGVIALCELLETLDPDQKKYTAFVFFDNEEYGLLGSAFFRKLHKKRSNQFLLINLDCISDGDHITMVSSKAARKKWGNFGKRLPVYVASVATWFVTGIWHGLTPNFVLWGMLNCFVIVVSEELNPLYGKFHSRLGWKEKKWYGAFEILRMFVLMNMIRIVDLFPNVGDYFARMGSLFTTFNFHVLWDGTMLKLGLTELDYIILGASVLLVFVISLIQEKKGSVREMLHEANPVLRYALIFGLLVAVLLLGRYGLGYDSGNFIYNQF